MGVGRKIEKLVRFGEKRFMLFDRYEIHIKAFVNFTNGKLMSGHSSSSTFHVFKNNKSNIINNETTT